MSETTHIICAHCGEDNAISNRQDSDGTLVVTLAMLTFTCKHCKVSYQLPFSYGHVALVTTK